MDTMTSPVQLTLLQIVLTLAVPALSRTSLFVTLSSHRIPMMDQRLCCHWYFIHLFAAPAGLNEVDHVLW